MSGPIFGAALGRVLAAVDPRMGLADVLGGTYVRDASDAGQAEHAFWVFGLPFLVLHYRIRAKHPNR